MKVSKKVYKKENRKIIEKNRENHDLVLKKINKIYKSLAKLTKEKKRRWTTKIRNESGRTITEYASQWDSLDEITKTLESNKAKLIHEEIQKP